MRPATEFAGHGERRAHTQAVGGWRRVVLGAVFASLPILFLGPLARPTPAAPMYWGATIHPEVYGDQVSELTAWNTFEQHAGKRITVLNIGQPWGTFDTNMFQIIRDRGAFPLVTMRLSSDVTLADVVAGRQDRVIRAWAQKARAWGFPFLFRPWWEMNGDWYHWGRSPDYVAAWRRFHDLVVAEGATNVTWAWVTNTIWWDPGSDPAPYYPGSVYVDWVAVDAYNWGRNPLQPDRWTTPEETLTPTLSRLRQIAPGKPICVCELASTEIGGDKAAWVSEMLWKYLPHHPEIKAFLWFNWNYEQNGGRWDWPIESSPRALTAFRQGISDPTYLSTLPPMPPLAKVPIPTAPTETQGTGSGPVDIRSPQATITGHPPDRSRRRTVRFRFRSSEGGSTFRCKLDGRPFRRCRSPRIYRNLTPGRHTFRVRAIDQAGNTDPTPARFTFRILR